MINHIVMLASKGDNRILRFGLANARLGLVCIAILVVGVTFFTALPAKYSYQSVAVDEIAKKPKKLYEIATSRPAFAENEEKSSDVGLQRADEPVVAPPSPAVPAPSPPPAPTKATSTPTPTPASSRTAPLTSEPYSATPPAPAAPAPVLATYAPEPEPTPATLPEPEAPPAPATLPEPSVAEDAIVPYDTSETVPSEPTSTEPTDVPVAPEEPTTWGTPSTPEPPPVERNSPPAKGEDPSSGSCQPPTCQITVVGDGNLITSPTPKTAPTR